MHTDSRSNPRARQSRPLRAKVLGGLGVALLGAAALAGCSSNSSSSPNSTAEAVGSSVAGAASSLAGAASSAASAASSVLTAPDAGNNVIREAAVAATGAESGEWQGSTLKLTFATGSKGDTMANAYCVALAQIISSGEKAVLVYPDGELDCPAA